MTTHVQRGVDDQFTTPLGFQIVLPWYDKRVWDATAQPPERSSTICWRRQQRRRLKPEA